MLDDVQPITAELRSRMLEVPGVDGVLTINGDEFANLCDQIDAVDANLREENLRLQRGDAELIVDMLRKLKREGGAIASTLNQLDGARAARDYWRARYQELLKETEHDGDGEL